jgi:hypothetical protein
MPNSRKSAAQIVASFERYVEDAAMAGGGHPDLIEWHKERLLIARERIIQHIMGNPLAAAALKMPPQPHVEYDR